LGFNDSLWFGRQLQNRRLLTPTQSWAVLPFARTRIGSFVRRARLRGLAVILAVLVVDG
jgi:hypothetical protein